MLDALPHGAVVSNLPNPHREAREIDRLLRERAATGDVVVADMRREGPRSWRGRLSSDLFHPNDRGYADMATVVEHAVDRTGVVLDVGSLDPVVAGPERGARAVGDADPRKTLPGAP